MLSSLYLKSQSGSPPLRIGLLLDTPLLPRCFAEVVDHILQSNFARIELLAFNADTENWTPHPDNPISTDVRNDRGAGAIFRHNGKLFGPSQDCSKNYGYSFALNEIVALDRWRYRETQSGTITPRWKRGLVGTLRTAMQVRLRSLMDVRPWPPLASAAVIE